MKPPGSRPGLRCRGGCRPLLFLAAGAVLLVVLLLRASTGPGSQEKKVRKGGRGRAAEPVRIMTEDDSGGGGGGRSRSSGSGSSSSSSSSSVDSGGGDDGLRKGGGAVGGAAGKQQQQGATAAAAAAAQGLDPFAAPPSAFELALRACTNLTCLREAHKQPKLPAQFNFPHFYILGYQKCATTSLFHHLIQHPTIMAPRIKEPGFFTDRCGDDALGCPPHEQEKYVTSTLHRDLALSARLYMATFEGTTHYAKAGKWLAPQLKELMPWLKLVISMREPISQAISMRLHNLGHNRIPECYDRATDMIHVCIKEDLEKGRARYAPSLQAWLQHFPAEQLHIIQYESLTAAEGPGMARALREVKRFLGLDPKLPSDDLGMFNNRRQVEHSAGWPMPRRAYTKLISLAREEGQEVAGLLQRHGFSAGATWLQSWEKAWKANLERCKPGPHGLCMVQLT